MAKISKVPYQAAKVSGSGGKGLKAQGVLSGKGATSSGTLKVANQGQGTKTYKNNFTRAQVTGLKKGGSKSVTGGKTGPSGRS